MISRRDFIVMAAALLTPPLAAEAQQAAKVPRIGWLGGAPSRGTHLREAFLQELRDRGYVEGRNVVIETRSAEGKPERLPALAAELVALKVDVIVASGGTSVALAAKQATQAIPIVFVGPSDPLASGLITSVGRPAGNVTGPSSIFSPELVAKGIELLKQTVPTVSRVAILWAPADMPEQQAKVMLKAVDGAAQALGVRLHVVEARGPQDVDRAFSEITKARADALTVLA